MRKQRLVAAGIAGIAAVALAVTGGTAVALQDHGRDRGAGHAATASGERHAPSAVRVVRPYEPVEIGQGALMGLLPEGRQNYVVAWGGPEDFREQVEQARQYAGDDLRPNTVSGGISSSPEHGVLFTGAFRTDVVPGRITVRTAGGTFDASMLRLPGNPGWGTYYLDAGRTDALAAPVTVTAYAPDGTVIDELVMEHPTR
ncbi:MAG TPA: hypothetical protein VE546_01675 [Streptomyces sp.]|uniref:hypothetical protein n=1 Tax=Streptomyces sp. TaxID=1931 RepID=UPI002D276B4D|nr:hypothetical protein [Streptomyces sp.]HZG02281.1 hypothetical protein [Streptomyces sp.]